MDSRTRTVVLCLIASELCVSMCFARAATGQASTPSAASKQDIDTSELTTSGINVDTLNTGSHNRYSLLKRFYSRNSRKFVRFNKTTFDGMGEQKDNDSKLLVESDGAGEISIKSYRWGYYLCFDSNGNVVPMLPVKGKAPTSCIFYQKEKHGYSVFKSKSNTNWFLAITKDGKPKNAKKTSASQRASHFLEY